MRHLAALSSAMALLTALPAHAACPAAPVGKASDAVAQMLTSGTSGFGPTSALDATREGSMVYDSTAKTLKYCDGTAWVAVSLGVPSGAIWAFDLASCPAGWTEYAAARGRFLRGIDNGAGNDPDGTRAPGATQADDLKSHTHRLRMQFGTAPNAAYPPPNSEYMMMTNDAGYGFAQGTNGQIEGTGGAETRPKNVAVLFCRKT